MSILLTKAQKVGGFDCPNGTLVIGLEKDVEALAAQGGGALPLDIGLVSGAGKRARLAMFGSSLTDVCFVNSAAYGVRRRLNRSWIDWANYKLAGKQLDVTATFAVGGQTALQIIEQIRAAVALDVEWVGGDLGIVNSISGAVALATMQAQTVQAIDLIADSGKRGFLLNATPVAVGHGLSALYVHQQMAAVNKTMADYGRKRGVLVLDACTLLSDGTSAIGSAVASLLQADYIHYANTGSRVIGNGLADLLAPELYEYPLLPGTQAASYSATDNPNQLATNPLMLGTQAVGGASGLTGNVSTGITVSTAGGTVTGTCAVAARADGKGQDTVITVTAASAASVRMFVTIEPDMTAVVAAGDVLEGIAAIDITGAANLKGQLFRISPSQTSEYAGINEVSAEAAAISEYSQADLTGGVMVTPRLTLPAGSTNLRLILELEWASTTATAVIKIGRKAVNRIVA